MGRSVAVPRDAIATAYEQWFDHYQDEDDDYLSEPEPGDWDDFLDSVRERAIEKWPSMVPVEEYRDELTGVAGNDFVTIVVAEYFGIASISVVPTNDSPRVMGLALGWARSIVPEFERTFGTMRRLGTMSNGESVFEAIDAPGELRVERGSPLSLA